jgi:hypothetical protein
MIVVEAREGATDHCIAEVTGPIVRGNATREFLRDTEMTRTPSDGIAKSKKAIRLSGDGTLAGLCRGMSVGLNTAREIETSFLWRVDMKKGLYSRHTAWCNLTP